MKLPSIRLGTSQSPGRAFTLLEVVVAVGLMLGLLTLVAGMLGSANATTGVVTSMSEAQLQAERVAELIRSELVTASSDGAGSSTALTVVPGTLVGGNQVGNEVVYTRMDPTRLDLQKDIMDLGLAPGSVPWEAETRVIKFELTGAEAGGAPNVDDDGDLLVDEGRIALYRRSSGVDSLIAVLATDVRDGRTLPLVPGKSAPINLFELNTSGGLPRLWINVVVERPIRAAVRGTADLAALKAGGGPVARYRARELVTLLN